MSSVLISYFSLSLLMAFLAFQRPVVSSPPPEPAAPATAGLSRSTGSSFDSILLLPDLQALPPSDLEIELEAGGHRRLLRLSVSVINRGTGALELLGESNPRSGTTAVSQHIYTTGGKLLEIPVGSFVFHPSHGHWHLENFAQYELWSLTYGGTLKHVIANNGKVSFCLRDFSRGVGGEVAIAAYTDCGNDLQGLSLGWLDTYRYHLAGQYIDISAVPDGTYAVRVTVDPLDLLLEGREGNNSGQVYVQIVGSEVRIINNKSTLAYLLAPNLE